MGFPVVAEVDDDEEKDLFTDGHVPVPQWEPSFCVLLQDMGKFTLHGSEQVRPVWFSDALAKVRKKLFI